MCLMWFCGIDQGVNDIENWMINHHCYIYGLSTNISVSGDIHHWETFNNIKPQ